MANLEARRLDLGMDAEPHRDQATDVDHDLRRALVAAAKGRPQKRQELVTAAGQRRFRRPSEQGGGVGKDKDQGVK